MESIKRNELPPHPLSDLEKEYIASLSPDLKELHTIAQESLGSSYFVKYTHGYKKWIKNRK